jgi:argininosuccinate synthase
MAAQRVVLAYSGDLVTSAALAWLLERGHDVATVTVDVGQGRDLSDVRDRALGIGAARAHVFDLRDVFARDGVAPAWSEPLDKPKAAALARPVVAKHTIEVAAIEGAAAIAHGGAYPADDAAGVDNALRVTGLDLPVIAPAREWGMDRPALLEFARERGIPVPSPHALAMTDVRTLWGRAVTADVLADPDAEAPSSLFVLTRPVTDWPKEASVVEITLTNGIPTALNGVAMPLVDVIVSLETIAGAHGIGRLDHPAVPGVRPRTIEEIPASMLLHEALSFLGSGDGVVKATCFAGEAQLVGRGSVGRGFSPAERGQ